MKEDQKEEKHKQGAEGKEAEKVIEEADEASETQVVTMLEKTEGEEEEEEDHEGEEGEVEEQGKETQVVTMPEETEEEAPAPKKRKRRTTIRDDEEEEEELGNKEEEPATNSESEQEEEEPATNYESQQPEEEPQTHSEEEGEQGIKKKAEDKQEKGEGEEDDEDSAESNKVETGKAATATEIIRAKVAAMVQGQVVANEQPDFQGRLLKIVLDHYLTLEAVKTPTAHTDEATLIAFTTHYKCSIHAFTAEGTGQPKVFGNGRLELYILMDRGMTCPLLRESKDDNCSRGKKMVPNFKIAINKQSYHLLAVPQDDQRVLRTLAILAEIFFYKRNFTSFQGSMTVVSVSMPQGEPSGLRSCKLIYQKANGEVFRLHDKAEGMTDYHAT
jgi:hypothetical protein